MGKWWRRGRGERERRKEAGDRPLHCVFFYHVHLLGSSRFISDLTIWKAFLMEQNSEQLRAHGITIYCHRFNFSPLLGMLTGLRKEQVAFFFVSLSTALSDTARSQLFWELTKLYLNKPKMAYGLHPRGHMNPLADDSSHVSIRF